MHLMLRQTRGWQWTAGPNSPLHHTGSPAECTCSCKAQLCPLVTLWHHQHPSQNPTVSLNLKNPDLNRKGVYPLLHFKAKRCLIMISTGMNSSSSPLNCKLEIHKEKKIVLYLFSWESCSYLKLLEYNTNCWTLSVFSLTNTTSNKQHFTIQYPTPYPLNIWIWVLVLASHQTYTTVL